MTKSLKYLFIVLGFVSVTLGVIGIFVPLLPTTPFIILAAYFFSKGSKKYHDWLLSQKVLGEILISWEQDKSISKKTKITSVSMIVLFYIFSLLVFKLTLIYKMIIAVSLALVVCFILTRKTTASSL